MMRYARLWPPPWCRVVIRPWLLRPPFLGSGRVSDFSGVVRVISTKPATEEPRRPGGVGLYLGIAISVTCYLVDALQPGQETGPPKMSMRWPSARLTMARLVSLRLPIPLRVRRVLPARLMVLTEVTLTPKTFSTAILISVLLASGATRKVYLLASRRP